MTFINGDASKYELTFVRQAATPAAIAMFGLKNPAGGPADESTGRPGSRRSGKMTESPGSETGASFSLVAPLAPVLKPGPLSLPRQVGALQGLLAAPLGLSGPA